MRWKARPWFVPLSVILVLFLFRSSIYRSVMSYQVFKEIPVQTLESEACVLSTDIEDLMSNSLSFVSDDLHFVWTSANTKVNKMQNGSDANCIGYSAYFAAHLRKCLEENNIEQQFIIKHQRAHIFLWSWNVHSLINHSFFADHDMVEVTDKASGQQWIIDPSLYDYLWIKSY